MLKSCCCDKRAEAVAEALCASARLGDRDHVERFHAGIFFSELLGLVVAEIAAHFSRHAFVAHRSAVGLDEEMQPIPPLRTPHMLEDKVDVGPHGNRRIGVAKKNAVPESSFAPLGNREGTAPRGISTRMDVRDVERVTQSDLGSSRSRTRRSVSARSGYPCSIKTGRAAVRPYRRASA